MEKRTKRASKTTRTKACGGRCKTAKKSNMEASTSVGKTTRSKRAKTTRTKACS